MTEPTARCVICTGDKAAHIGHLCRGHHEWLAAMLRDVEEQACLLSAVPSMQQRMDSGGGSLASTRAPARLDVLVHTDRRRGTGMSETDDDALAAGHTLPILDVLHSWARIVREERNYADRAAITITGERDVLSRHLDWCAAQDWCDEFYTEVRTLVSQLKSVNGRQDEKPVGRCYLPGENATCDGPIWIDEAQGHAHCGRCRATWDGQRLATLQWELEEAKRPRTDDGRRMLTADELANKHRVKRGTIAVWAHRRGVVSVGGYYDPAWFDDKATA